MYDGVGFHNFKRDSPDYDSVKHKKGTFMETFIFLMPTIWGLKTDLVVP